MKDTLPVVVGPTACGKTDTAVALAKILDGEIISADSMQIYKHMDIGTAKPTFQEMQDIPHHLIDCVAPDEAYSVAQFKEDALACVADIIQRGKIPIIAGGTGLYINALTLPWGFREKDTDPEVRKQLEEECARIGNQAFYDKLKAVDPKACETIHPNNTKRVVRALEIYTVTGKTKSDLDAEAQQEALPYDYVLMGIAMERQALYTRIDKRVDGMIAKGLTDEVKNLLEAGYGRDLIAMKAIGYKEFFPYFDREQSLDEAVYILKRDTRHFAKRQLTWFRRDERIQWFDRADYAEPKAMAQAMADYYQNSIH